LSTSPSRKCPQMTQKMKLKLPQKLKLFVS
jgi:hypothetical protein